MDLGSSEPKVKLEPSSVFQPAKVYPVLVGAVGSVVTDPRSTYSVATTEPPALSKVMLCPSRRTGHRYTSFPLTVPRLASGVVAPLVRDQPIA